MFNSTAQLYPDASDCTLVYYDQADTCLISLLQEVCISSVAVCLRATCVSSGPKKVHSWILAEQLNYYCLSTKDQVWWSCQSKTRPCSTNCAWEPRMNVISGCSIFMLRWTSLAEVGTHMISGEVSRSRRYCNAWPTRDEAGASSWTSSPYKNQFNIEESTWLSYQILSW